MSKNKSSGLTLIIGDIKEINGQGDRAIVPSSFLEQMKEHDRIFLIKNEYMERTYQCYGGPEAVHKIEEEINGRLKEFRKRIHGLSKEEYTKYVTTFTLYSEHPIDKQKRISLPSELRGEKTLVYIPGGDYLLLTTQKQYEKNFIKRE